MAVAPLLLAQGSPTTTRIEASANQALSPVWLEVSVNGQPAEILLLLRDPAGHLWAVASDLQHWRLPLPKAASQLYQGEAYYPLDGLPGLTYRLEEARQAASISAPANLFSETVIDQQRLRYATPERSAPGAFLNYDVIVAHAQAQETNDTQPTTAGGSFEGGAFGSWGVGTTSFLWSDTSVSSAFTRMDSTWTQDHPSELASLRLGDSISGISSWSGAVHFGGIQWSTDFSTQPGFVTTPLIAVKGEAVLPSTIDLYINNALRMQTEVPPGPFAIVNLPVITGAGVAQVVERNIMGQEQTISVPYYSSPLLLRAGLSSFSYEIGFARDNYGLASDDYGRAMAVATYRVGYTDTFTFEEHAELLAGQQTAGIAGDWLAGGFAVLNGAVSASHALQGDGAQVLLGISRDAHFLSFGASARLASADYVQLGLLPGQQSPVRMLQGSVSVPLPERGSLGINYLQNDYRDMLPEHLLSVQATWPVAFGGFLNIEALKPLTGNTAPTLSISLTYLLGHRTSANASVIRQQGADQQQLELQRNLPAGTGYGYRLTADTQPTDSGSASFDYQNNYGTYLLSAYDSSGQTSESAEARGGIALLNGELHLSRQLDQSFAVVRVGDYPGIRVYSDNQLVAVTNSNGVAMLPLLRPYEVNSVRIDPDDLPLDAQVDLYEKDAVPYRRSGILVDFKARPSAGALISLMLPNGQPMPIGAVAQLVGSEPEFPIGKDGAVYVTGLTKESVIRVRQLSGQLCEVRFAFAPSADPVPWLGPYICVTVRP